RSDQREPRGQAAPEALDQLEEIVGAVDLVHLAGDRVPDDDCRAVDPPRHDLLFAHDLLGLELRAVIGMLERLARVEHVLAEGASVRARDRDRGGVMEAAGCERAGDGDRMAGPLDVREAVLRLARGHVVDGGEMEEVVDLAAQLSDLLRIEPEQRLAQVPEHRPDPPGSAPAMDERVEPSDRLRPHEHVDLAVAREQPFDQMATDEPGRAGHEVAHVTTLPAGRRPVTRSSLAGCRRGEGYQPPCQSALAMRRFLAALRASLRLSSRHWSRLSTRISVGKNAITMKPASVTTLSSAGP